MATKNTALVELQHHGQTHANAQCRQCEWVEQDRNTAGAQATKHCKETGHKVTVEKSYSYTIFNKK